MLRSWDLKLRLNKADRLSIYLQIAQKIIEEIQSGRLPPSAVLPGTRELALELGVNRKTVILAYDELIAQGWLSTEPRRGTFVSENLPNFLSQERHPLPVLEGILPKGPLSLSPAENADRGDDAISFNDGIPDTRLIPFEVLSRAFRHALIASARVNRLGYDNPKGILDLRKSLAAMLNMERGLHVDENHICTVRGSQMGIFLAARILTRPNDYVVVEALTYPPAYQAFKSCGANIIQVGLDEHGIKEDELERVCRQHPVRAVYVTPHHQFPTTVMMTAERRLKLLLLAEQYDFAIVEDDYDHEFHFSHHPVFPLASTDPTGRVIYVGSLSKVLAPGLRVGYVVASPDFIDQCAGEIMLIDRQGNSVTELAVAELMKTGELKRHIRRTYKIYQERRNELADLLTSTLGEFVDFDLPHGGLAFWLRIKDADSFGRFMSRTLEEKVHVLPSALFARSGEEASALRLGYGSLNGAELKKGVQRLKLAFST